jgi:hypothetical protein
MKFFVKILRGPLRQILRDLLADARTKLPLRFLKKKYLIWQSGFGNGFSYFFSKNIENPFPKPNHLLSPTDSATNLPKSNPK